MHEKPRRPSETVSISISKCLCQGAVSGFHAIKFRGTRAGSVCTNDKECRIKKGQEGGKGDEEAHGEEEFRF